LKILGVIAVFGFSVKPRALGNFRQVLVVRGPSHFILGWFQFFGDGLHFEFLLCDR